MTKKQRALEIIERLKKNIRMQDVHWIMIKRGSFWSVSGWRRNVQTPVVNVVVEGYMENIYRRGVSFRGCE